MRPTCILTIALASTFVLGCSSAQKRAANPSNPATANVLAQVRLHAQHFDPAARVGLVIEADPRSRLVAVGDVNPADFRVDQKVSFVDSKENALTAGTVVRILSNSIHVRYDPPALGKRAPRRGDIMIGFKPAI